MCLLKKLLGLAPQNSFLGLRLDLGIYVLITIPLYSVGCYPYPHLGISILGEKCNQKASLFSFCCSKIAQFSEFKNYFEVSILGIREGRISPGRGSQLVRSSSPYSKVVGSISGQERYKRQPMNAEISGTINRCFSLPPSICSTLPPFLSFCSKINFYFIFLKDFIYCPGWCDSVD